MHFSISLPFILSVLAVMTTAKVAAAQGTIDTQRMGSLEALLVAREFAGLERRQGVNLQTFTGALGGIAASPITNSGNAQRLFEVDGNTFTDFPSAASRSCSDQHTSCANFANSNKSAGFTVGQCDSQQTACNAAAATATQTAFQVMVSSNAEFEFFCDE